MAGVRTGGGQAGVRTGEHADERTHGYGLGEKVKNFFGSVMSLWLMVLAALALWVRGGLLLHQVGSCRSKNAVAMAVGALIQMSVVALVFWGACTLFLSTSSGWQLAGALEGKLAIYLVLALLACGLLQGAMAERTRLGALLIGAGVLAIVLPAAMWVLWYGRLARHGVIDVAGASVLHLLPAAFACAGAWRVGPRLGKFNHDGSANAICGHNLPLHWAGVALIWLGWIFYILLCTFLHQPQSFPEAAGTGLLNVLLAGSAGMLGGLVYGRWKFGKPEMMLAGGGLLAGLVAISGVGALCAPWQAALAGAVAGPLACWMSVVLDLRLRIDDPTGSIAVHGMGGLVGMLWPALWLTTTHSAGSQLLRQGAVGAAAIAVGAAAGLVVFSILAKLGQLRSSEADEFDGLDLAENDLNAYPDFQQNMIKSYHLREA